MRSRRAAAWTTRKTAFRSAARHEPRHAPRRVRQTRAVRRAARTLGVLVPRRRVAARGARRARGRARLRRARAHRPRRRLRLARVRARREALRRPPDHRRRGDARRRRPRHAALRDAGGLREPLPASSPTRTRARACPAGSASCCRPGRASTSSPSMPKGSSRSPAARGTGSASSTRTPRRGSRARFPGAFYVELQRPYERGDARRNARAARARRDARRADRRNRRRARAPSSAAPACRTRSSRSGTARRSTAASASGAATTRASSLAPAEMLERLPRDAARAHARGRRALRVRPDAGARLPLSRLLRRARPRRRAAARRSATAHSPSATRDANGHKRRARERLDDELQLIARLGLAGFFLLHWEVLELARECALEVRGPGSPRHALPPGRGRGSSVGSIVCYLTGLSHVDPVEAGLSLGRFINDEMVAVPDIDLDFPRDIREKLIVRVTERYGREHAALVASFATYRSRGAIRDVGKALGLPFAELERLARVTDGWDATRIADELDGCPGTHAGPRWDALPHADARDRRPAAPHQPAPGRHGHLDPAADRPRAGAARGDGRAADLPVGQGQLRRRRLPEDRPARARDALGGRGCDRPHRAAARRDDRPLADPAHRRRRLRGDPAGGHGRRLPDREPRADAEPAADAPREPRRPDRAGGARPSRADPGQGRASVHRAPPAAARGSVVRAAGRARVAARGCCATRSASSSSRTRCSTSRWPPPASRSARRRACGAR